MPSKLSWIALSKLLEFLYKSEILFGNIIQIVISSQERCEYCFHRIQFYQAVSCNHQIMIEV